MRFSQFLARAVIVCLAHLGHAVAFVGPLIAAPIMFLIRDAPAAALNLFIVSVSPIGFRVLRLLKPEYRESWLTDGQSLQAV